MMSGQMNEDSDVDSSNPNPAGNEWVMPPEAAAEPAVAAGGSANPAPAGRWSLRWPSVAKAAALVAVGLVIGGGVAFAAQHRQTGTGASGAIGSDGHHGPGGLQG